MPACSSEKPSVVTRLHGATPQKTTIFKTTTVRITRIRREIREEQLEKNNVQVGIIIQKDAIEYGLFKSVNCSTCFGWYFTHHQELITLYLQYLALMRPLLLPTTAGPSPATFTTGSSTDLINARYCRYSVMSS